MVVIPGIILLPEGKIMFYIACGEVPERSNGAVSKTVVPSGTQGSNPCLSGSFFCDFLTL